MSALTTLTLPAISDGYSAYLRQIEKIPLLSQEEETQLAISYRQNNDISAARRLALSHLRLVVSVAKNYLGYGLDRSDLIQEGNIGLLKAVKKFDPSRGARLGTYAVYCIRAEIHNFIMNQWRIVKIATTKSQRKLFFNMRRLFEQHNGIIRDSKIVAAELNVKEKDVHDMRARIKNTNTISVDSSPDTHDNKRVLEIAAEDIDPETIFIDNTTAKENKERLLAALNLLDERSREVIHARHLQSSSTTLQNLAQKFDISAERVRQIEVRALQKLRGYLTSN